VADLLSIGKSIWTADELATDGRGWSFNLAIFRVSFLAGAVLPWALSNFFWIREVLGTLPRTLWVPVSFYRFLPFAVFSSVSLATALSVLNLALVCLGIVGLFTRSALAVSTILSLYLFGLSENFGKINHFHHLVWFMGLLAAGPAGRCLSIDSLRSAIKAADQRSLGISKWPYDALWTLRYVWALMGALYFYPGFAKLWIALFRGWASPENLRNIMWSKWFETLRYDLYTTLPPRADLLPDRLLALAGWGVIVFEVGFIVLALIRALRPCAFLGGLLFHVSNGIILRIWFTTLFAVYPGLIDWSALSRGWRRSSEPLRVFYDGSCQMCRRTIAILQSLDIGNALHLDPILTEADRPPEFPELSYEMLTRDLYAAEGRSVTSGYDSYVTISRRMVLLWPLSLLLRLPLVAAVGRNIYRRVADSRHCALVPPPKTPSSETVSSTTLVHLIGATLLLFEVFVSSIMLLHAEMARQTAKYLPFAAPTIERFATLRFVWPFDKYPTFAYRQAREVQMLEVRWLCPSGEVRAAPHDYVSAFRDSGTAWAIVADNSITDPEDIRNRALSLARSLWKYEFSSIRSSAQIARVYRVRYKLASGNPPAVLLNETLLYSFPLETVE